MLVDLYTDENVMNNKIIEWMAEKINILLMEESIKKPDLKDFNKIYNLDDLYNKLKGAYYENVRYSAIYNRVVSRIMHHDDKDNLVQILHINMKDSIDSCQTGQFSKLISTLSGHFDDMKLNFTPSECLQYAVANIYFKLADDKINYDTAIETVKKLCLEHNSPQDRTKAYIQEFVNYRKLNYHDSDDADMWCVNKFRQNWLEICALIFTYLLFASAALIIISIASHYIVHLCNTSFVDIMNYIN